MTNKAVINFNSGEVTPEIYERRDIEKYSGGCRKCENFIPDIYGNATRRPGTEMILSKQGDGRNSACVFPPPPSDPTKISISTAEELQKISYDIDYPSDGDYELANDIDCSGISQWEPIGGRHVDYGGENVFTGTFDGRYYTISNVSHEFNHYQNGCGFFGEVNGATIKRVIIKNINIHKKDFFGSGPVGLLCGRTTGNDVTVTDCYVQGSFSYTHSSSDNGVATVGGVIGTIGVTSIIQRCGCDIEISSEKLLGICGGFVGSSPSGGVTITDCYAIGSINAGTQKLNGVGGFIGSQTYRTGTVEQVLTNCYSAVSITGKEYRDPSYIGGWLGYFGTTSTADGDYTACFWDDTKMDEGTITDQDDDIYDCGRLDTTGLDGNLDGVTKSTTALMQIEKTYTDAGWDFTPNTGVWRIKPDDYPRHQWHNKAIDCVWVYW